MDRKSVEKGWAARGFSCDLWVDPPGQCWEDFVHRTDELLMLVEGALEVEIDGRVHRPQIGEELLIPAGAHHSVRNTGSVTARWLYGYKAT
ncbi:cupin domain-containing protein [Microbulbifer taiwanensis]|uniref:Cupin domain-containing protein n=1 Tax=Microbulbifer taiwanensis TaxID=986746 RepID=A0ABW1YIC1_9GAMM|nr:cupin domain-containing protein [Microbulbifer taiwanensis]